MREVMKKKEKKEGEEENVRKPPGTVMPYERHLTPSPGYRAGPQANFLQSPAVEFPSTWHSSKPLPSPSADPQLTS